MNIDSEKTRIKLIHDMSSDQAVKFVFEVITEIPCYNRIKSDLIILIVTKIVIILLMVISYSSYKQARIQRCDEADVHNVPE